MKSQHCYVWNRRILVVSLVRYCRHRILKCMYLLQKQQETIYLNHLKVLATPQMNACVVPTQPGLSKWHHFVVHTPRCHGSYVHTYATIAKLLALWHFWALLNSSETDVYKITLIKHTLCIKERFYAPLRIITPIYKGMHKFKWRTHTPTITPIGESFLRKGTQNLSFM